MSNMYDFIQIYIYFVDWGGTGIIRTDAFIRMVCK